MTATMPHPDHYPTCIASPFLETGSGRASLVADFGVLALAHYDPSYSEVVQRLPNTLKYLRRSPITNYSLQGRHFHLDALTLGCIAVQLMRSGLGGLVLPLLSRTPARALVHASLGSTIAPTLAMMYHGPHRVQGHRRRPPTPCVNLCDQPQPGSLTCGAHPRAQKQVLRDFGQPAGHAAGARTAKTFISTQPSFSVPFSNLVLPSGA
ncbi:hypothetical protein D9619_006300 [Psilocybe cf. subviscida]|uniref:Uncharacterized protein n=1 Tax=Psilocybe cf. subviscida TaxID=2480587 RepID=A0A8H5B440_9AGAR|nr:hypothetical protein D9619_006300 [Psilocybe cf. subviscida]